MVSSDRNISPDSYAEMEVVHHVDSALAMMIAVVTFVMSVTMRREWGYDIAAVLTVVGVVISALIGILRQDWRFKLVAWWSVIFVGGFEVSDLSLRATGMYQRPAIASFLCYVVPGFLSYLLLKLVVVDAYLRRLSQVAEERRLGDIETYMRENCNKAILFPVMALLIAFLLYVVPLLRSM